MTKKRPSVELSARAFRVFSEWGWSLPTGAGGLTRKELRQLERAGLVSSQIRKLPSGSIVNLWKWDGER